MNLRSSSTPRFDGSAIATVSVRPSRLSGRTRCFVASSFGIIFAIFGSTSNRDRSTAGILCCLASIFVSSTSAQEAKLDEVVADARSALLLLLKRLCELLPGDQTLVYEEFTNWVSGSDVWSGHDAGSGKREAGSDGDATSARNQESQRLVSAAPVTTWSGSGLPRRSLPGLRKALICVNRGRSRNSEWRRFVPAPVWPRRILWRQRVQLHTLLPQ